MGIGLDVRLAAIAEHEPARRRVSSTPRRRGRGGEKNRPDGVRARRLPAARLHGVWAGQVHRERLMPGRPQSLCTGIGSAGKLRHPARSAPGARRARTPRSGPRARRLPAARLRGVWGVRRVESAPCRGGRSCGLQAPRPWLTLLRVGTRGRQRSRAHQRSWHHRGSLGAAARDGCARSAPVARVGAREAYRKLYNERSLLRDYLRRSQPAPTPLAPRPSPPALRPTGWADESSGPVSYKL